MNTKDFIFVYYLLMLITITALIFFSTNYIRKDINNLETKIDSLTTIVIEMKSTIDTTVVTQAKHFGECSFISNQDIGIGYDGHLYSIDWRRRHGRESKMNN